MATPNQPFNVLANSLQDLFKSYHQLEESLKSLSKDVFKIQVDSQSAAVDISIFSETTRMNLVSYLTSVKDMSTAMVDEKLENCNFRAILAKTVMTKSLNSDIKEVNADRMLEAVESVIKLLRSCEESKQQVSEENVEKLIKDASEEANSIIKGFIMGLLQKIKKEISKATDDSKLLKNSSDLKKEVEEVKQAVTAVKNTCEENLSALDKIISSISELSAKEKNEDVLRPLKASAEIVLEICDKGLSSVVVWLVSVHTYLRSFTRVRGTLAWEKRHSLNYLRIVRDLFQKCNTSIGN